MPSQHDTPLDTSPEAAAVPALPGAAPHLLIRYGELTLKGNNRDQFISRLRRNVVRQTAGISPVKVELLFSRMLVTPERRAEDVARRLQEIFGIHSISPVWRAPLETAAILELARAVTFDVLKEHQGREVSFRVETTRADKRFPHTSSAFDRLAGEYVLRGTSGVRVDLERPEVTLGIDIRTEGAYVFARRLPGLRGLPVGSSGRGLCLLSGGIDSPVAAWMAMRRGMWTSFVTYHSYPYIGDASKEKVIALARSLARFQPSARLYVVPFAECQVAIRDSAPEAYRTVLYRRMMQRLAARLCQQHDMQALITGESLGQVASQTIENLTCIGSATELPVLRPLIGLDKDDTIAMARQIGTFELSNRQEPDCCTVFMPDRPVISGRLELCLRFEAEFDVAGLCERALAAVETVDFEI